MVDWSALHIPTLALFWASTFIFTLILFRGFYSSIFDPLAFNLFYVSSLSAPVFYFALVKNKTGLYPLLAALAIFLYIFGLRYFCAGLGLSLSRRSSPSANFLSVNVSPTMWAVLFFANCGSLYCSISTLTQIVSTGSYFIARYSALENGRNPLITIISTASDPIQYLFMGLIIVCAFGGAKFDPTYGRLLPKRFLLSFNVIAWAMTIVVLLISGSRSFLVSSVISIGISLSFLQWIYPSPQVKRLIRGLIITGIAAIFLAVVSETIFLSLVQKSNSYDFSAGFDNIFVRLFSSADGFILQESFGAYSLFDDSNPLRFVTGPYSPLFGVKNPASYGNLLFELAGSQSLNTGSNYNLLHSLFSFGFYAFPVLLFLILSYVVGFRFISLKFARLRKGEISHFRVDDRILLSYILYSECFMIVSDLELGFFRLGIFSFCILIYFLMRLAFRSLFG